MRSHFFRSDVVIDARLWASLFVESTLRYRLSPERSHILMDRTSSMDVLDGLLSETILIKIMQNERSLESVFSICVVGLVLC